MVRRPRWTDPGRERPVARRSRRHGHKDRRARTGGGTAICAARLAQFIRFLTGSNLHRNGYGSEPNCVSQICTTTEPLGSKMVHMHILAELC